MIGVCHVNALNSEVISMSITNGDDLLDWFSEKAVRATLTEQADRKREVDLARIREFRYINISADAGTVIH
jgi:hypothetical protein